MNTAVIGLGFGDEGEGLATDFLCSGLKAAGQHPLVVRFNGGHQAGHTVVRDNKRHVFSSFGSGTMLGCPTYWSEACTFYPTAFLNERLALEAKVEAMPDFFVHPLAPVTTPLDVAFNQYEANSGSGNGTVGVGFGTTLEREKNHYHLFVQDLFHEKVFEQKLKAIGKYYGDYNTDLQGFIADCLECRERIRLNPSPRSITHGSLVYEGAQGILLDQKFGFFPNVTRSNVTSTGLPVQEVLYVTRTYQTRHGNGYMSNEGQPITLKNASNETNQNHLFQGAFRVAPLDVDLLKYSLACDGVRFTGRNLLITCNDQYEVDVEKLADSLGMFRRLYVSNGPSAEDIKQLR